MTIQVTENHAQYPQNGPGSGPVVGSVYFVDDFGRAKTLLAELDGLGVVLSIKGDRLAFDAPAGVITDDLLGRMRVERDGLMALLRPRPSEPAAANRPSVVHLKRDRFDVRIDRESKWGNPFVIGRDGDRAEVIRKYRAWIVGQAELMAVLPELRGKVLGCWCSPLSCHGDVLADLVEALDDSAEPVTDAVPGPIIATTIRCPRCGGGDLGDDVRGLRCCHCDRLSWVVTDEGGLARRDVAEIELVDPDLVPICPSCRRWCGVMTMAEAWRCSRCDPDADDRRRRTLRVLSLVSRSRG